MEVRIILKIYLKSGNVIDIECENWEFDRNADGEFLGYKITGIKSPKKFGIVPSEIVAYVDTGK